MYCSCTVREGVRASLLPHQTSPSPLPPCSSTAPLWAYTVRARLRLSLSLLPVSAANFMSLYQHLIASGLRTRISLNNTAAHKEASITFCLVENILPTARIPSCCRRRRRRRCQRRSGAMAATACEATVLPPQQHTPQLQQPPPPSSLPTNPPPTSPSPSPSLASPLAKLT